MLKMRKWIGDRLESAPSATIFNLCHASVEGLGSDIVLKIPVGEDRKSLDDEIERISNEVNEAAQQHASAFQGLRQRYKLIAETEEEQLAQFLFTLGSKEPQMEVGLSEPATERGVLGQLMRHNENVTRQLVDVVNATIGPVISENQSLRRQRDDWESKRLEAHLTLEDLLSRKHERDIELDEYEAQQKRKNNAWDALINKWGPEVIKRIDLPFLEPPKQLGEKSNGSNGSNGQNVNPKIVMEQHQHALRSIFKVIDRDSIYDCLDPPQKQQLDGLLGLGDDPSDIQEFKVTLFTIWKSLPDEVTNSMTETLLEKDKEKAKLFLALVNG